MQAASIYRRFPRVLSRVTPSLSSASEIELNGGFIISSRSFSSFKPNYSNSILLGKSQFSKMNPFCSPAIVANYSSDSSLAPSENVKKVYDEITKRIEEKTMRSDWPLGRLTYNHGIRNIEDLKLLFEILQKYKAYKSSVLMIHDKFDWFISENTIRACIRVGAMDLALKSLKRRNVYGLAPTISCAHILFRYAIEKSDLELTEKIMQACERNSIRLDTEATGFVLRVCYNTGNWETMNKYAKKFIQNGPGLRNIDYIRWMDMAADVGDSEAIWKINSLRTSQPKYPRVPTSIIFAQAYLLENKPDSAAKAFLRQHKQLTIYEKREADEKLQELIIEWPLEVVKRKEESEREVFMESLRNNISAMVEILNNKKADLFRAYLLENKPDSAASAFLCQYKHLNKYEKREAEEKLQALISEWPLHVVNRKEESEREVCMESLRSNISAMVEILNNNKGTPRALRELFKI